MRLYYINLYVFAESGFHKFLIIISSSLVFHNTLKPKSLLANIGFVVQNFPQRTIAHTLTHKNLQRDNHNQLEPIYLKMTTGADFPCSPINYACLGALGDQAPTLWPRQIDPPHWDHGKNQCWPVPRF
jgi:hypothetical protein